jgi:protein disulfide-isomerase A6
MLVPTFALLVASLEMDLTIANVRQIIGGAKPVFVKFYTPDCRHCQALAPEFSDAAELISDVIFADVNCQEEEAICHIFNVTTIPELVLFPTGSTEGIPFTADRTSENMCNFLSENTEFKCRIRVEYLHEANPLSLDRLCKEKACVIVTFLTTWSDECKAWIPHAQIAAMAMAGERNVSFGMTNCERWGELCDVYEIRKFPTIKLFKGDDVIDYSGPQNHTSIIQFINQNCGTDRQPDGFLFDEAGLVRAAQPLVAEFLKADDKYAVIEKMKKIPGTEIYLKVMQRVMTHGVQQIPKDLVSMEDLMDVKKSSWAAIDAMKRRYNVFSQFSPKETLDEL